jgi:polyisoprenoid-binding protein YceI
LWRYINLEEEDIVKNYRIVWGLLIAVGIAVAGCGNPADNVPSAEVGDAISKTAAVGDTTYTIAEESKISFVGSKVTGSHDGGFTSFSGTVTMDGANIESAQISILISTPSIFSDNTRLTNHLKSADFFDVETFPEAEFVSTSVTEAAGEYSVSGNLTLHGVTKGITFPAAISVEDDKLTANASFSLNRTDFGLDYPGKANDLIREEVVISFDVVSS